MSREIKFRAFDKSDGRMLNVCEPEEQGKREYYPFEVQIGFSHWKKEDIVLMQFTGLKDKNGTDIYEGDYVTYIQNGILQYREIYWDEPTASFLSKNIHFKDDVLFGLSWMMNNGILKVVGNAYETPQIKTVNPSQQTDK